MDTVLDSTILGDVKNYSKILFIFLDINTIYCAPARDKSMLDIVLSNPHGRIAPFDI